MEAFEIFSIFDIKKFEGKKRKKDMRKNSDKF